MARAQITAFVGLNQTAFQRGLRKMRRGWRSFKRSVVAPMMRFGSNMGRAFLRGAVVVIGAFAAMVKAGNDFRRQMAEVSTMLDGQDLNQFSEGILKMAARFGMAKTSLTKGLYDILSAGIAASDGLSVLEVATRAAIGGATDTATSVDALTTVLNAYGMSGKEAAHVSDILFQVVKDGKITYAELAENIGKLAPTARAAGLSLQEMGAAVAAIVKVEKPERAMTAIRAAMIKAAEGGETLFELVKRFKGASLEDIIGGGVNKRAAQGVAILAGNFETLQKEIQNFQNVAGNTDRAFAKMDRVRHWQKMWQTMLSVITRVGVALDKALGPAVDMLTRKINGLADTPGFTTFLERVQSAAEIITKALIAMASGGGARTKAFKGLGLVIQGAWMTAVQKASAFLLRVAPLIGRAIGAAAKSAFGSPVKDFIDREGVKGVVLRAAPSGTISKEQREELIDFGVGELKKRRLKAKLAGIGKEFNDEFSTAGNMVAAGLELLTEAGNEAVKDMEEFNKDAGSAGRRVKINQGTGATEIAGTMNAEEGGGRRFSELRKIGANIIGGGGNEVDKFITEMRKVEEEIKKSNEELSTQTEVLISIGENMERKDDSAKF